MNNNNIKLNETPENTLLERYLIRVSHREPRVGGKIDLGLFRTNDIPEFRNYVCLSTTKPGREMPCIHSKVPFVKKGVGRIYAVTAYRIRTSSSSGYRIVAKAVNNQQLSRCLENALAIQDI